MCGPQELFGPEETLRTFWPSPVVGVRDRDVKDDKQAGEAMLLQQLGVQEPLVHLEDAAPQQRRELLVVQGTAHPPPARGAAGEIWGELRGRRGGIQR